MRQCPSHTSTEFQVRPRYVIRSRTSKPVLSDCHFCTWIQCVIQYTLNRNFNFYMQQEPYLPVGACNACLHVSVQIVCRSLFIYVYLPSLDGSERLSNGGLLEIRRPELGSCSLHQGGKGKPMGWQAQAQKREEPPLRFLQTVRCIKALWVGL